MALKLNSPDRLGNDAYWKIMSFNFSRHYGDVTISLGRWKDRDDRLDNPNEPLRTTLISFSGSDFDFNETDLLEPQLYDKIKTLPDWADAEDI